MTHNDLKAKLIAEWKASAACKRIEALESYAYVHGLSEFDGEIIPDFLSRTYDEIAMAAGEAGKVELLFDAAGVSYAKGYNACRAQSSRQLAEHFED